MSYAGKKVCAAKDCTNSFTGDRWGNIRANRDGWFLQRNGTVWCPSDIPAWVPEWRYAKKSESVSKDTDEKKPLTRGPTDMWETRGGEPNATPSEQKPDSSQNDDCMTKEENE